jgi:hypothetical protein
LKRREQGSTNPVIAPIGHCSRDNSRNRWQPPTLAHFC